MYELSIHFRSLKYVRMRNFTLSKCHTYKQKVLTRGKQFRIYLYILHSQFNPKSIPKSCRMGEKALLNGQTSLTLNHWQHFTFQVKLYNL